MAPAEGGGPLWRWSEGGGEDGCGHGLREEGQELRSNRAPLRGSKSTQGLFLGEGVLGTTFLPAVAQALPCLQHWPLRQGRLIASMDL